jgi:hypothetical protein
MWRIHLAHDSVDSSISGEDLRSASRLVSVTSCRQRLVSLDAYGPTKDNNVESVKPEVQKDHRYRLCWHLTCRFAYFLISLNAKMATPGISKAVLRLHFLCAFFALGSFVWGLAITSFC